MSISDYIVIMKLGVIMQTGRPQWVYDDPANLFVAKFLGAPPINLFAGKVESGKLYIGDVAVMDAVMGNVNFAVLGHLRNHSFVRRYLFAEVNAFFGFFIENKYLMLF